MTDARSDGGATVSGGVDAAETTVGRNGESVTSGEAVGIADRIGRAVRQIGALADAEIRLGLRRRWAPMLVGLFAAFGLLVLTFAGSAPGPEGLERTAASLATLSVYLVPLAGLAYGYSAVVGPAESGWLAILASLPTTRARILLGAFAGRAIVLAGGVALGFALPGAVLVSEYGLAAWGALAIVLIATTGLGIAFLAIAVLLSSVVREKTHALGAALLAWVWFVLIHDLLALGFVAALDLPAGSVRAMVLANPASTYRVLALELLGAGGAGGFAGITAGLRISSSLLGAGLFAWIVLPVATAAFLARRATTPA